MEFKAMENYWLLTKLCIELNVYAVVILTPQLCADRLSVQLSFQMAAFVSHEITPALHHQTPMGIPHLSTIHLVHVSKISCAPQHLNPNPVLQYSPQIHAAHRR